MEIVEIHSAQERELAAALLNEGFPEADFEWSIAFEAPPGKYGHGLLLMIDNEPQGEMLCFEKIETINGRAQRIVNVSSWYVREQYRRYLIWMVRHLTEDPEIVLTACTPSPVVSRIGEKVGFRHVSEGSIASIPLLNGFFRNPEVQVLPYEASLLDAETRQKIEDHDNEQTISLILRSGVLVAPLVMVTGMDVLQLPAARLLFTTDFTLLKKALPEVHSFLFRKFAIVGIYLPRISELEGLKSIRPTRSGPSIIAKGDIEDADVNLLYSELHYLPVSRRTFSQRMKRALRRLRPSLN
ncbi:MAG: hypothetical protein AAGF67_10225 [Verrucomicrobiota bacterium]